MRSFSALAVLLLAASAFAADAKQKIAVLGVRVEGGVSQGTANLLSELISSDVQKTEAYDVLTSADVATMLGVERQRQLMGCSDDESCFAEIGAALGAALVLDASVGTVGNLRVLSLRLVDNRKAKVLARESISVSDESALVGAAHTAVSHVFGVKVVGATDDLGVPGVSAARSRSPVGFVLLGGAGALAIAGGIVGGLALSDYNAFKASPFNDGLGSSAKTKAYAADGLYVGAAVVAVVAVLYLVLAK